MNEALAGPDATPLREQLEDAIRKRVPNPGRHVWRQRGTVSNALASLKREGVLGARRKKGIFLLTKQQEKRKRTGNIGVLVRRADRPVEFQRLQWPACIRRGRRLQRAVPGHAAARRPRRWLCLKASATLMRWPT